MLQLDLTTNHRIKNGDSWLKKGSAATAAAEQAQELGAAAPQAEQAGVAKGLETAARLGTKKAWCNLGLVPSAAQEQETAAVQAKRTAAERNWWVVQLVELRTAGPD